MQRASKKMVANTHPLAVCSPAPGLVAAAPRRDAGPGVAASFTIAPILIRPSPLMLLRRLLVLSSLAWALSSAASEPVSGIAAQGMEDCARAKYQRHALAQQQWQQGLAALIVRTDGQYKDLVAEQLAQQLRLIEMNRLVVEHLLSRKDSVLMLDGRPTNEWPGLLDRKGQAALLASSPRYAELSAQSRAERQAAASAGRSSRSEALGALVRGLATTSPAYQALLAELLAARAELERPGCARPAMPSR